MKATRLQGFCRDAGLRPRKRPRLCLFDTRSFIPCRPLSSCISHPARLADVQRDEDREVEARRQLEQMQLGGDFTAAPPIDLENQDGKGDEFAARSFLRKLRVIPRSPSYFTARPTFTDDLVHLQALLRKYTHLPTVRPLRRLAFVNLDTYTQTIGEKISPGQFNGIINALKRMNLIHPQLMPAEVRTALEKFRKDIQPYNNRPAPIVIDEYGRAGAVGRRKSSSAKAWVVEGQGEVIVNGMPLHQAFSRVHDRESVIWALKVTERVDKYNVFAVANGGGTTGQAEALTLAVSKALMAHEPSLKTLLRKAGCVARDPRRVERKKPGRVKARKMPAWVKR